MMHLRVGRWKGAIYDMGADGHASIQDTEYPGEDPRGGECNFVRLQELKDLRHLIDTAIGALEADERQREKNQRENYLYRLEQVAQKLPTPPTGG